jgi:predicted dehydrogenase/threonine dehydrogenase-like Zn-dependent dehydrogenase
MKQVIRKGLKDIIVDEVPDPVLLPHHVLVRPLYSLISSGTETASIHRDSLLKEVGDNPSHLRKIWDVAMKTGPLATFAEVRAKFSEYAVLGYSGAGVVAARHPTVTDLEIGERVAYGGEGTGHGETILVGRNLAARMPEGLGCEEACFATLGAIAMNAVRTARIELGDVVAVIGLGLVGQLVAQLVRLQGGVVIGIDLNVHRVDLAKSLGADHGIGGASAVEGVRSITDGRGVDCAIVAAAAKSPAPAQQALNLCRDRGRICVVGAVGMEFPWNDMYLKEIQLYMSRAYGPGSYDASYEKQGRDYPLPYVRWTENRNMEEFLRLIAAGRIDVRPLVTHEFALDDAAKGYDTIFDRTANSLAILLKYPAATQPDAVAAFAPARKIGVGGWGVGDGVRPRQKGVASFALVGAGNLAKWEHLPNLKKLNGVELRAVYSAAGVRGKSYALRFGAAYATSEYEEILKDPQIDAVLIASRNQHHAPQALAALRAGKHVFVEKPMALTAAECAELCDAVEETGRHLTVGFNRRFAPYYRELKSALERRTAPAVVQCRINSPGISGAYWMADPAIGGAILGEACHFIDLMYWLLSSEPVSVSAYSLPTGKADPIGENNIVASFRFEDGSIGNLTYCTVGSRTSGGERVEVFAQGIGGFSEDFKRTGVWKGTRSGKSKMWPDKGYFGQMADFAESIRTGRPPSVTVRDGARATLGCLAMMASAKDGAPAAIRI